MRYLDRSRIETDWQCPRKRYWQYEYAQTGIIPTVNNPTLEFGTIIHSTLAQLFATPNALEDVLVTSPLDSLVDPQWRALAEGQIRGFARLYLPSLLSLNKQLLVERELTFHLSPDLLYMVRLDLLRQNHQGEWWYREWKTTGFQDAKWLTSWSHQPQCHVNAYLAEKILNIEIVGIEVFGLYKGRKDYKIPERQDSPLIWGWKTSGTPGMVSDRYSYVYQPGKGWTKFPVWEDQGVLAWIQEMPEDLLRAQYPEAPPVFLDRQLAKTFLDQALTRELEIVNTPYRAFPQHFSQCDPPFGSSCAYKECCFQPWVGNNPLKSGLFGRRVPHHRVEQLAVDH